MKMMVMRMLSDTTPTRVGSCGAFVGIRVVAFCGHFPGRGVY
jgi:hypothetical protein